MTTLKMQTKIVLGDGGPQVRKTEEPAGSNPNADKDVYTEKQSENLFHRTEVLAGENLCMDIGNSSVICAVSLSLL
ncbi:hypothetical protein AB205_0068640 [Aquarana catesbeiana]|uniref:Uncharacterized protein n=1 Tax=Aquarana catesbeiana TaxID=8400 RepID=A0A2G9S551_AQUCT|nr:hypothetical protein AB205_0068640 [Aquarana catesbeiana]